MSARYQRAALWVVALLVVGGLFGLQRHEGDVRREQFCHLINASHAEHRKQYRKTVEFLKDKRAKRTGLVPFIQAGLPAQRHEIKVERKAIPEVCLGVDPKPEPLT